ncbi:MAG: hypothetical protein ABIS45_17095 [Burkholderiales bacterium]
MPPDSARKGRWYPLLVLIPAGVVIPALAATMSHTGPSQPLRELVLPAAWNFIPFAALMIVVAVTLRYCSTLTAWLTSIAGMITASILFVIMLGQAESALLAKHWTAAALASGFAALYATTAASVVAVTVAVLMWLVYDRRRSR